MCGAHFVLCACVYSFSLAQPQQQQQMVDVYLNGCLLWFAYANTLFFSPPLPFDDTIQINFFELKKMRRNKKNYVNRPQMYVFLEKLTEQRQWTVDQLTIEYFET